MASGGESKNEELEITLAGYFTKQGEIYRTWKRRFFVLRGTLLTYYTKEGDSTEKGTIDLTRGYGVRDKIDTMGLGGVEWPSNVSSNVAFGIAVEDRTYYLYGEDVEEVKKWRQTLQQIINEHGNPNAHPYKDSQGQTEPTLSKIIRNATKISTKMTKQRKSTDPVECTRITPLDSEEEEED